MNGITTCTQGLLMDFFIEFTKMIQLQGENPLRCTTQDKKGLVLSIVLFYPIS